RVHEVALDRIACGERDVVAALHHARAAAFPEESLDGDRDRQRRIGVVRVQRGEETRAAGAEDQDVGADPLERHGVPTPRSRNTCARAACASCFTISYALPSTLSIATSSGPKSRTRNFHSVS